MAANYVLLEKITVGAAGASSVTFSGIPQTGYTDLVVKINARMTNAGPNWSKMQLNGSASNFTVRYLEGSGSGASSANTATNYQGLDTGTTATANVFSNNEIYIPNYASANYKSYSVDTVTENNATAAYMGLLAGLWSNTAAITSIMLYPDSGNYAQYSTFYLYGVAALGTTPVIVPYATGGDTIMTDGTYWYHAFLSSGTFTPATGKILACDALVVAGGGGGGLENAGGGGGGGVYNFSALTLSTATSITVGAGGAGTTSSSSTGTVGGNSIISTITAGGGGGGGSRFAPNGGTGGSGGGQGKDGAASPGSASGAGTGNAGGTATYSSPGWPGGGGGGYSAVGANVVNGSTGANGGAGLTLNASLQTILSPVTVVASGGGGGTRDNLTAGTGGTGAGNGTGVNAGPGGDATTFGGGGGGGGQSGRGGNGFSGIVVVRYAI